MKVRIAMLLAGLILGSAGTATAAANFYWSKGNTRYVCTGVSSGASCRMKGTPWRVYVLKNDVSISYGDEPIFSCGRYDDPYDCNDYR